MKNNILRLSYLNMFAHINMFSGNGAGCVDVCIDPADPAYVEPPPPPGVIKNLLSGVNGWFALHCSAGNFNDITDQAEWEAYIAAGLLFGRVGCNIKATKPAPTPVRKAVGACGVEKPTTSTDVWTFTDEGEDDDLNVTALYCFMKQNGSQYSYGFTTCSGRVYAPKKMTFLSFEPFETDSNDDFYGHTAIFENKRAANTCCEQFAIPFVVDTLDLRYVPQVP